MNPLLFAQRYFGEYKTRGDELIPKLCPFCHGGDNNRDTDTFALNVSNLTYNCKRGNCNVSGTFNQLCEQFGETTKTHEIRTPKQKTYMLPKTQTTQPGNKAEQYLKKRGFSKETWVRRKVSESGGNIVFLYYENGQVVLMKFREPKDHTGEGKKAWREPGGKSVFWGMDDCDPSKPLVIVEGEYDALALDEAGCTNVVSVPSGNKDLDCVENCWEWLQQFKRVIIWPDNDEPGQEMCRKLIKRLGEWRCWVVDSEFKDANDCLKNKGREVVRQSVITAREVPINGLIRLADVETFDYSQYERVPSSLKSINKVVGGYMLGLTSIWTGINSSGKSTFLGQELLTAIDNGYGVCAFSGELPAAIFRYWIDLQAAGPGNITAKHDAIKDKEVYHATPEATKKIREWYYNKFFLYDKFGGVTQDTLLEVFKYAAMRYNCKVFLVDNLMVMVNSGGDKEYYRKQEAFVEAIINFSHDYNVHTHLVAHPRKTDGRVKKVDVMGAGAVTNRPDNVFSVHRNSKEEIKKEGCDSFIDVFKNRIDGQQGDEVAAMFCDKTKRFYQASSLIGRNFEYGWQKN